MLEQRIGTTRPDAHVLVGREAKTFDDHTLTKAIYATRWDGSVVLSEKPNGEITRMGTDVAAKP